VEVFYEAPDPIRCLFSETLTERTKQHTSFIYETRRKRRKEADVATKRKESLDFWGGVTIVLDLRD